jgi:hypothetical protein
MTGLAQVRILGNGRRGISQQKKPNKLKAKKNLSLSTVSDIE